MSEIRAHLDKIVRSLTKERHATELEPARQEYQAATGEVYEDDPSFEMRMILFLEWFIFDRPLARGVVPLRAYLEEHGPWLSLLEREMTEALLQQRRALFRVRKAKPPVLHLRDLWQGKTVRVEAGDLARSFQAGDLIDARVVPFRDKLYFTEGMLCHPAEAEGYIKSAVKALRKKGAAEPGPLCQKLAAMLLKYDRSRGIKPELIYRDA
jgi:hypothetical protein